MTIPNDPISRVLRASIAKWAALKTPWGATKDETDALAAQRRDFTAGLYDALRPVAARHKGDREFLPALGKVLGEVEAESGELGVPSVGTLANRVARILGDSEAAAKNREPRRCAFCHNTADLQPGDPLYVGQEPTCCVCLDDRVRREWQHAQEAGLTVKTPRSPDGRGGAEWEFSR